MPTWMLMPIILLNCDSSWFPYFLIMSFKMSIHRRLRKQRSSKNILIILELLKIKREIPSDSNRNQWRHFSCLMTSRCLIKCVVANLMRQPSSLALITWPVLTASTTPTTTTTTLTATKEKQTLANFLKVISKTVETIRAKFLAENYSFTCNTTSPEQQHFWLKKLYFLNCRFNAEC